jgi:hypothetical protein
MLTVGEAARPPSTCAKRGHLANQMLSRGRWLRQLVPPYTCGPTAYNFCNLVVIVELGIVSRPQAI